MKTITKTLGSVFIILFAGCSAKRYGYIPTTHNVPVFTKKFDSKIAANYSTDGGSSHTYEDSTEHEESSTGGLDIQAAFAITNHVAIQGGYYYRNEHASAFSKYHFANSNIRYRRNLFEFGAGYFTPVDEKQHLYFQLYAGAGFGKTTLQESGMDISQSPYTRSYNANTFKLYLEPSLTFRTKIAFAGTIYTRASIIKFGNVRSDFTKNESLELKLDSLDRYSVLFLEPGVIASLGFRKLPGIRIDVQAGLSVLHQHSFIGYRPANMSIGLYFDIPKLIRWQKYEPYKW